MPIPDEKARVWTRPEDYWPPRRPRRSDRQAAIRRAAVANDRGDPADDPRPWLGVVPYALLMMGLAILAVGIIVVAWPGNRAPMKAPAKAEVTTVEVGTAPKG